MQQNTGVNNTSPLIKTAISRATRELPDFNNDGTVVGNYSNEQEQVLGQIVLANFANNEGLASRGDNVWAATQARGCAAGYRRFRQLR